MFGYFRHFLSLQIIKFRFFEELISEKLFLIFLNFYFSGFFTVLHSYLSLRSISFKYSNSIMNLIYFTWYDFDFVMNISVIGQMMFDDIMLLCINCLQDMIRSLFFMVLCMISVQLIYENPSYSHIISIFQTTSSASTLTSYKRQCR